MGEIARAVSPETLADNWAIRQELDGLVLTLPKEPETIDLEGSGRVIVSDEFGDAFGVLEGPPELLSIAFGRALDRLYDVEWGTATSPQVEPLSGEATFVGFGEDYIGRWRQRGSRWLFAVVRPERRPLADAFVGGASVRA